MRQPQRSHSPLAPAIVLSLGLAAIPTSLIGMWGSVHTRCNDCHDILTGVEIYTSPWFGRFFWLLLAGVSATITGIAWLVVRQSNRRHATPRPDWYPDPWGTGRELRYWSGSAWTEHTAVALV